MKNIFFIVMSIVMLFGCHTTRPVMDKPVIEKDDSRKLNGNWQLEMLFSSDNHWSKPPFINIRANDKAFSGNTGCNSISGKFSANGNYFGIDKNIISTKMACADAKGNRDEKIFLSALLKINRFTLTKDELELGQDEITLMKFRRSAN